MSHERGSSDKGRLVPVAAVLAFVVALAAPAAGAAGLWNISRIGAPAPADGTVIAVVDTGVDAAHPAFGGRVLSELDFVGDGRKGDGNGHGTHVSGTAAGGAIDCTDNGVTDPVTVGVASTAKILPVRVLDAEGSGTMRAVADGIRAAADKGATVINLSLGPEVAVSNQLNGGGGTLLDAIEYAWSKGSIPVLASGNDRVFGFLGSGYGDIHAVVVTATTSADRKASYATAVGSARWGIAAPGGDNSRRPGQDILSAWPDQQCGLLAGTSMAAPHVSGALAVLRSRGLSPQQAVDRLLATATPISPASTYGAGLVNLAKASAGLGGAEAPAPTPAPSTPAEATGTGTPKSPVSTTRAPAAGGSSATTSPPSDAPRPSSSGGVPDTRVASPATDAASSESSAADTDADSSSPPTGATETAAETAAGLSNVIDEDAGGPVSPALVVVAGGLVVGLWLIAGRTALRLRSDHP